MLVCDDKFQAYHRELLEHMPPPSPLRSRPRPRPPVAVIPEPLAFLRSNRSPMKKNPRRGRGERKSSSKRHHRVGIANIVNNLM